MDFKGGEVVQMKGRKKKVFRTKRMEVPSLLGRVGKDDLLAGES